MSATGPAPNNQWVKDQFVGNKTRYGADRSHWNQWCKACLNRAARAILDDEINRANQSLIDSIRPEEDIKTAIMAEKIIPPVVSKIDVLVNHLVQCQSAGPEVQGQALQEKTARMERSKGNQRERFRVTPMGSPTVVLGGPSTPSMSYPPSFRPQDFQDAYTTWPQRILDRFARIPHNTTIVSKYYGVYNHILCRETFASNEYVTEPQYALPSAQGPGVPTADSIVSFVVTVNDLPVFFLEIKPPGHIQYLSTRAAADAQMRERMTSFFDLIRTPRLHGVSALGSRLAFYCLDRTLGSVTPEYVAAPPTQIVDTAPEARWEVDITTEDGYHRFMDVVQDVKRMVHAL